MTVINALYLIVMIGFFAYLALGMRKASRYDDPEYQRKQDEHAERALRAAEKQAAALERIAAKL